MTRAELLRDLYVWAHERWTQAYVAIKKNLAEPGPVRLGWRDLIKSIVREVVQKPGQETLTIIRHAVETDVPGAKRGNAQMMVIEELHRLHEGGLARYGLRPPEFALWTASKTR